ncbi:MAG TPA: ATP-binding protein [Acidimicrobiales bacterium]|nr:ATP-binding protein [Acidimicrobiales bacterium]
MTRRLLIGYLSVTAFMLVILEVPLGATFARFERSNLIAGVERDALTIALHVEESLEEGRHAELQGVVDRYEATTGGRAVVVDRQGTLLADSDPLAPGPRDFAGRPEVAGALEGKQVRGFRRSDTLDTELLYVAVPVVSGNELRGVVRITYPASVMQQRIVRTWAVLAGVGLVVLGFVTLLSLRLARAVTQPLRELEAAASRLGEGELDARAPVPDGPSELRLLAEEFNATAAKLERLVDAQRAFVADASHQLRTPLAALRLRLEVLQGDVPERAREDVEGALAEVHRLSRLVNGLLELARAEHRPSNCVPVDVAGVLHDRRTTWAPLAEEREVSLVDRAADGVVASAAPGNLEQVLDNLIANAVEVSPAGRTVTLTAKVVDEWIEVHVVDEGPGMAPERRAAAFDRFWHAAGDAGSSIGGFGIGLAIVRQLVVADGGEVELLEAPGGGLDACVRLRPARRSAKRPTPAEDEADRAKVTDRAGPPV